MKASNAISSRKAPPKSLPGNAESSCSTAERFTLAGPSIALDPRTHAYRSDLADIALAGQLFAPHYARAALWTCEAPTQAFSGPSEASEALFEMVAGEEFALLDITGRWAWGYRRSDHKVGYILAEILRES